MLIIVFFQRSSETQDTLIDPPNDDLFLPDNLSDKEKAVLKNKKKKLRIRDLVKKPCLGPGCEKLAVRPCLYCSEECIERFVNMHTVIIHVLYMLMYTYGDCVYMYMYTCTSMIVVCYVCTCVDYTVIQKNFNTL